MVNNMETNKFIIAFDDNTKNKYIVSMYRNSVSTSTDIGDAIEFNTEEEAKVVANYLNCRYNTEIYYPMVIKTQIIKL